MTINNADCLRGTRRSFVIFGAGICLMAFTVAASWMFMWVFFLFLGAGLTMLGVILSAFYSLVQFYNNIRER